MTPAAKAIVQAGGIHAFAAALAAAAPRMNLHCNTIAELEFIGGWAEFNHRAHVFVTGRIALVEG